MTEGLRVKKEISGEHTLQGVIEKLAAHGKGGEWTTGELE